MMMVMAMNVVMKKWGDGNDNDDILTGCVGLIASKMAN